MTNALLWSHFEPTWPTNGPGHIGGSFETIPAWGLPLVNTMLLLSSGVTITIAHHALRAGHRKALLFWLGATVVLGAAFLFFQASEYIHAYHEFNLPLGSGIDRKRAVEGQGGSVRGERGWRRNIKKKNK